MRDMKVASLWEKIHNPRFEQFTHCTNCIIELLLFIFFREGGGVHVISNKYEPKSDVIQSKPICATSQRSMTFTIMKSQSVVLCLQQYGENNAKIYDV